MKASVRWWMPMLVASWICLGGGFEAVAQEPAAPEAVAGDLTDEYGPSLPVNIANHDYAHMVDKLIHVVHWFMAILFVAWGVFFVYCLIRFRMRPGHAASSAMVKAKASKYAEIGVAVFEAFLLIGLSIPAWASVKNDLPGPEKNPLHVRVVAEQFAWNFHYPGADGVFGNTSPNLIDLATNPVGVDRTGHGEDDIVAGQFHIPVDRPVIVELSSKDVIHSFFIPVLRVKQDTIPGMRIPVWFEAGKTGRYEISCAQLCGNNHYSMRALMVVQTPEEFAAWLEERSAPPEFFDDFD